MKVFPYTTITNSDNFRFKISRDTLRVKSFEVHTHEFSELVIILGGTALHLTDNGHYPLTAGDVFALNGDMAHGFEACEGLRLCNMMYDPEAMLPQTGDLQQLAGYQALFVVEPLYRANHPMHNLLRLSMQSLTQVDGMLDIILAEYKQKSVGYASMIEAIFLQLVVMLSRLYATQIDETRGESVGRLALALTLIETQYHQTLSLDDLAGAAHLSATHFLRLFKETFNLSPVQYLIRLRIAKACALLNDKTLTMSEIAARVGFEDSNYFSRQFKQVIGVSPRDYRQRT